MNSTFPITLFYNVNDKLHFKTFDVKQNTSIECFIKDFKISSITNARTYEIGIYGKIKNRDYLIQPNDRLELYSKITADPKVRRKKLAKR